MGKYRKKPVVVEAWQLTRENWRELEGLDRRIKAIGNWKTPDDISGLNIHTLEGIMFADFGDWIIKGVKGEFYPVEDEIFRKTYEATE